MAPTRAASRSRRRTLSSIAVSATSPARTAATRASPHGPAGPGITRSSRPSPAAASERAANQSDMTTPSKPHSPLRTSRSIGCSVIVVPFTELYAAITVHAPASPMIASNGARYSSRRVRSSTRMSAVKRSVSESLATKCFTQAPTPSDCSPRTKAAPSRPLSRGSSERFSKWRPPYGVRCRLTVGASTTSTPLRRASAASSRPMSSSRSSSHVAARAVGDGTLADGSRSSHRSPRTPAGPSDVTRRRRPMAGSAGSAHPSAPVSSRTFCSSVSAASRV